MTMRLSGLHIAHLIETNGPGGAERMLVHMVQELEAAGCYNVVVLPAGGEEWLQAELAGTHAAIEPYQLDRPVSRRLAGWLGDVLARHQIAIAHSHEFSMAVYAAWAAWRTGIPHVTTMHGSRYYIEHMRRRLALRAAFAVTGRVVAVSETLAAQLRRDLWLPKSRVTTIRNGVRAAPATRNTSLRRALGLAPHERLVLAVGNLYPVKGHRFAVDALPHLPGVHLAIAGRGDLAEALTTRATQLGVGGRLHLLGLRSDIATLLASADAFILPSLSEGVPMALLEAMFAGCAIVASDVGDVRAALDDGGAGMLVAPGDTAALAAALAQLLASPARARELGAQAARRASAEYDVRRMVARYVAIYRELLGDEPTTLIPEPLVSASYGTLT